MFNHRGRPIGVLWPVSGVQLSWAYNELGSASMSVPRGSTCWNTTYIRPGNRLEYHHASLEKPWIGELLDYGGSGPDAQLQFVSAENLYFQRVGEEYWACQGTETAGAIFSILHNMAVRREGLGIVPGDIWTGGPTYANEYALPVIGEAFNELAEATGGSWWVEKTERSLAAPWKLCYQRYRGVDRSGSVLLCGEVVDEPEFRASAAELKTAMWLLGSDGSAEGGGDINDRQKIYLPYRDARAAYGLREGILDMPEVFEPQLLNEAGYRELVRVGRPLKALGINVDDRYGAWGSFWLGDTVRVMARNADFVGFDGPARVKGIQVEVDTMRMGLVVEVL